MYHDRGKARPIGDGSDPPAHQGRGAGGSRGAAIGPQVVKHKRIGQGCRAADPVISPKQSDTTLGHIGYYSVCTTDCT